MSAKLSYRMLTFVSHFLLNDYLARFSYKAMWTMKVQGK